MKLVWNWKDAWKWLSIHAGVLTAVIGALQASLPYFQGLISPTAFGWITAGCGVAVIWARLIAQSE